MLNLETYQVGMAKLQSVFHSNLDEIKAAAYLQALSRLTDSAFNFAVDEIIRTGKTFPKPVDIREASFAYRVETPQISNTEDKNLPDDKRQKHTESAKMVMEMMFSDKISRDHKVEAFRHMDRAYPGIGWAEEGVKLKKYFDRDIEREAA